MDGPATGAVDMGAEGCGGGIGGCAAREAASAIDRFISASCDGLPAAAAGLGAALGTLGADVDGAEGVDTPPGDPDIGLVGAVTRGGVAPEPPDPPGRLGMTGAPGPSAGAGASFEGGGACWPPAVSEPASPEIPEGEPCGGALTPFFPLLPTSFAAAGGDWFPGVASTSEVVDRAWLLAGRICGSTFVGMSLTWGASGR